MSIGATHQATSQILSLLMLQCVAEAAWGATREERKTRFHNGYPCPTRTVPYGAANRDGHLAHERCVLSGCLDLFHDVVVHVLIKLGAEEESAVDNPAAFSFRIASRELVEVKRNERSHSGFPAKPTRNDGVAGRVNAALDSHHDDHGAWLVALFRILRSYPFSSQHVPGRWPVEGLAQERARRLPRETSSPEIVRLEISQVMSIATTVAGPDWVYTNLTLPIQASGARAELPDTLASPSEDVETRILCGRLRETYQHLRRAGLTPQQAFADAALQVTGLPAPLITPELAEALEELEPTFAHAA